MRSPPRCWTESTVRVHLNLAFREPLSGPVRLPDVEPGVWTCRLATREPLIARAGPAPSSSPGPARVRDAEEVARATRRSAARRGLERRPLRTQPRRRLPGAARHAPTSATGSSGSSCSAIRRSAARFPRCSSATASTTIVVRGAGSRTTTPATRVAAFADAVTVPEPVDPAAARSWLGRWVVASRALLGRDEPPGAALDRDLRRARRVRPRSSPPSARRSPAGCWSRRSGARPGRTTGSCSAHPGSSAKPTGSCRARRSRCTPTAASPASTARSRPRSASRSRARPDADRPASRACCSATSRCCTTSASLLLGDGEPRPRIQLIVGNDGGGTIFDGLEVAATADPALARPRAATPRSARRLRRARRRLRLGVPARREPRRARPGAHAHPPDHVARSRCRWPR